MSGPRLATCLDREAMTVQVPYLLTGGVVLFSALVLYLTRLPDIVEATDE